MALTAYLRYLTSEKLFKKNMICSAWFMLLFCLVQDIYDPYNTVKKNVNCFIYWHAAIELINRMNGGVIR